MLLLSDSFFFCNFFLSMWEQPCPAKVLWYKTKTDEVKCGLNSVFLGTEHSWCVTMKMRMSKEWMTLSPSLFLYSWMLTLPPVTLKETGPLWTVMPPPLLAARLPTKAAVDVFLQGANRPADSQYCRWNLIERNMYLASVSVIRLSDPAITLPQLHS